MKIDEFKEHKDRIKTQLEAAGMTSYGFTKFETNYLPEIIHENENIIGVVYGRLDNSVVSVMLVATDKRVIFVDCRLLFRTADEITYDVVVGIKLSIIKPFASIILHTRVKDYKLRYVNINCAKIFTKHIESYIEDFKPANTQNNPTINAKIKSIKIQDVKKEKIETDNNVVLGTNTAVLSTVDLSGNAHSSVIHYITDKDDNFYFLTKTNTGKVKNILNNKNVALNIHSEGSLRSLLIKGPATVVTDDSISAMVYHLISHAKNYKEGKKLPPVTKLKGGNYVIYQIKPVSSVLQDFSIYSW